MMTCSRKMEATIKTSQKTNEKHITGSQLRMNRG
jgi:hypothetical protein